LTVGNGLLGQIVVDDKSMLSTVSEEFPDTCPGEWSNVLERSGLGGGGGNNDGILHGVIFLEGLDELGNSGSLLSDGDVDAVKLLGLVVSVVPTLLVQNSVKGDSSLTSLTIANDQLTLATADGHHGVDRLETSLHGLVDGSAGENARGLELGTARLFGVKGSLSVNGVA
jgi:hypothetical protein